MTRALLLSQVDARLRTSQRGVITAVVIGGYFGGVLAAAGGLVLAGIRIGRKIA